VGNVFLVCVLFWGPSPTRARVLQLALQTSCALCTTFNPCGAFSFHLQGSSAYPLPLWGHEVWRRALSRAASSSLSYTGIVGPSKAVFLGHPHHPAVRASVLPLRQRYGYEALMTPSSYQPLHPEAYCLEFRSKIFDSARQRRH
jgi:hypothetical protein